MKVSYSIMAHPKRKEWAEKLAKKLNCPIYWDTDNKVWSTCKGAWKLADPKATHHCVIQDDAILSKNFKILSKKFIKQHPNTAINFYYGEKSNEADEVMEQGYLVKKQNAWGVAICLPTEWIDEMIRFGNGYYAWQDDVKIKHFLISKGYKTTFALPSLVDHKRIDINQTLTGCVDRDRYSPYFIDNI
jgi:hypothetical protein